MADFKTTIDIYVGVGETQGTSISKFGYLTLERETKYQYFSNTVYYRASFYRYSESEGGMPASFDPSYPLTIKTYNYTTEEQNSVDLFYGDSVGAYVLTRHPVELNGYAGGSFDTRITVESDLFRNEDGNRAIAEYTDTFELENRISRAVEVLTAPEFTDEDNPTITLLPNTKQNNYVTQVKAIISLDGTTHDIVRDLNVNETRTSYTFQLTDAERELIKNSITVGTSKQIKVMVYNKSEQRRGYAPYTPDYYSIVTTRVTLLNAVPVLNPTVEIVDSSTKNLTGNTDTVIKYYTFVDYAINAEVGKNATIVSQQVKNLNQISTAPTGQLAQVESGVFEFSATDSRSNTTNVVIEKSLVEYVKLTCNQHIVFDLSGETGATANVVISGNYFNDTFGAVPNELIIEMRHTQNDGTMGDWVTLTNGLIPEFDGNTYNLNITISGFEHYDMLYTFQCRAKDKIMIIETPEYGTKVQTIFDWGENDFNFNVPVTMRSDVSIGGSLTLQGNTVVDIVIEEGTESMGTNGTWYWRKWLSGRSECYGCRNFGNMAVGTAYGGLYRSDTFTQSLPYGLFNEIPEVIDISFRGATNYGGWVIRHEETAASNSDTGSFVIARPASATLQQAYVSFNVIGRWK